MATGPILVNSQQAEDAPSTSTDPTYDDLSQSRRNSMVFRSRQTSEEREDDEDSDEFCAEPNEIRKRRYSMDLNRTRSKTTSFLSSYLNHSTKVPNIDDNNMSSPDSQFATPLAKKNQNSRPNSPSVSGGRTMAVVSKRRLACIRRESDCSLENLTSNEFAHEKLVKNAQRVSIGFEEFSLDDRQQDERKRAKSLAEPISVFTNAFLPQSSSPSPKSVDQKQCYSPSTNQIVRGNIPYSYSSPSPTSSSPSSRTRIMRSMSPISVRQISKRRFTATGNGMESDVESTSQLGSSIKRQCLVPQRSAASPLVRDSLNVQNSNLEGQDMLESYRSLSPASVCSNSSSVHNSFSRPKFGADLSAQSDTQSISNIDDSFISTELPDQAFLNAANENSSTAFSSRAPSRAPTPFDEQMNEEIDGSSGSFVQSSPMRSSAAYNVAFGAFGRDSSLPPPSPLAQKSLSMNDYN